MDHLPRVPMDDEVGISPVVPCLALGTNFEYPREPQGSEGFRQFPSRHGYSFETLIDLAISDRKTCAFLQSWLFFGLLTETFSRPNYDFKREDFVRSNDDGNVMVTTKDLPRYLWYWLAARTQDDRDDMVKLEKTVDDCLRLAHYILHSVNQKERQSPLHGAAGPEWTVEVSVLISLSLLGDYLTFARGGLRQYTTTISLHWESAFLDAAMMEAGWCVGELSTLRNECSLSNRYYLSTINRKALARNHEKCKNGIACQAHQLDYRTYETRHAPDCANEDGCEEIGPAVEDVVRAIDEGGFALVETQGSHAPKVAQYGDRDGRNTLYVAISHVWSDGRGNPWRNCLRTCQLQYIQELVNKLYEPRYWPVPFWIDTLCIPVGREHTKSRRAAITRIAQTFRKADKVLVVDGSLQLCSHSSWVETLMRIQYSPWMTRLWTYLEGRVSRNLYFQLKNEAIPAEDLEHQLVRSDTLIRISNTLRELPDERLRSSPSAIHLIQAISTAKPSEYLTRYAAMPPQSDDEEEELRQGAIDLLLANKEYYALRTIWRPFLSELGLLDDLDAEDDEGDDMVRVDIEVINICPVMKHAFNSIASLRGKLSGLVFEQLSDMPDIQYTREGNVVARLFEEISSGLRARTTSWLDDETVCVGALLGVDLAKIQEVQPMGWWWRKRLDRIDSRKSPYPLFRSLGIEFGRWTEACQRERMKIFLEQVREFPLSIIFWNAPRLGSEQWTWALRSFMHRNIGSEYSFVLGVAKLGPTGLEVTTTAYKLSSPPFRTARSIGTLVPFSSTQRPAGNKLVIHPTEPTPDESFQRVWSRVEFVPDDYTIASKSASRLTWQDYIDKGIIDNLAILYRSQFGVLVQIYDVRDGVYLVRHVRLVRVANDSQEENIPVASGTWVNGGRWCIA
ncbi:hypothetical protein ANO14919_068450 [Xylariales sp. No.14919]|nr:hypothetical protein ANO14919_068450 [Xylariales sp. No.14919]